MFWKAPAIVAEGGADREAQLAWSVTEGEQRDTSSLHARLLLAAVLYVVVSAQLGWCCWQGGLIETEDIIVDAKSGVSGAGRGAKQNLLYTEIAEGINCYGVTRHRHMPEIEQVGRFTLRGFGMLAHLHRVGVQSKAMLCCKALLKTARLPAATTLLAEYRKTFVS